jgi:CRP-like cAMP-binding protein
LGDVTEQERLIEQYLVEDKKESAVRLLVELIVKNAKDKNFEQAETFRDKLFQVDALAVNEIVKTGEVIEAEKREAIDPHHLKTWAGLYDTLTAEEVTALFYSLKYTEHPADQMIYEQGEMRARLYFIDEGQLKIIYRRDGKDVLLKVLGPGEFFGEDTFFHADAFCSTSVVTNSPVKLHVLLKDDLDQLNSKTPGLASKLKDYCSSQESVAGLLKEKNLERRLERRLNLHGKITAQLLQSTDRPDRDPFKAELLDISASGIAFLMKTTEKVSTILLGRSLKINLTFDELGSDLQINRIGSVVAINSEPFHEYVVHAEFNQNLEADTMHELEDILKSAI